MNRRLILIPAGAVLVLAIMATAGLIVLPLIPAVVAASDRLDRFFGF